MRWSDEVSELIGSRRDLLRAAGATGLAALLGPGFAHAASPRGLKDIVSTRTFNAEVHIYHAEWYAGEGLGETIPVSRAQLVRDMQRMFWEEGEPGFEENLERLRRHRMAVSHVDRARALLDEFDEAGLDTGCHLVVDHAFMESNLGHRFKVDYDRLLSDARELREVFPGRLITFAGVDPRRGGAEGAALLRRAITEGGVSGLGEQVLQQYDVYPHDRERCYPLYEVCIEFGVPFYGNCEGPAPETMPTAYEVVARDFPELKICLAGAGRPRPNQEQLENGWQPTEDALRIAATYENVYLDMADWWRRDDASILRYLTFLRRCFDSDARKKVMFATDHPVFVAMGATKSWVDVVLEAQRLGVNFTDEEIALYYSGNALDFLSDVL